MIFKENEQQLLQLFFDFYLLTGVLLILNLVVGKTLHLNFPQCLIDLMFGNLAFFVTFLLYTQHSIYYPNSFRSRFIHLSNRSLYFFVGLNMRVNADADTEQATIQDSRVTPLGKFIRKTNIDELPQLLNVFMRQMSVIRPRPHMLKQTNQYSKLIEHYRTSHFIKPGISGWAQVNGIREDTDQLREMGKRVDYDMDYIENWHLLLDFKILFMPIFSKKVYQTAF